MWSSLLQTELEITWLMLGCRYFEGRALHWQEDSSRLAPGTSNLVLTVVSWGSTLLTFPKPLSLHPHNHSLTTPKVFARTHLLQLISSLAKPNSILSFSISSTSTSSIIFIFHHKLSSSLCAVSFFCLSMYLVQKLNSQLALSACSCLHANTCCSVLFRGPEFLMRKYALHRDQYNVGNHREKHLFSLLSK